MKTPLHTLRKEFGSVIAAKYGIHAASRLLRHADITTTAQYCLDKKKRVTSGLGRTTHLYYENLSADRSRGRGRSSGFGPIGAGPATRTYDHLFLPRRFFNRDGEY